MPFSSPLPGKRGKCEKIGLVLFHVILAKAGIQNFRSLRNFLDLGFHRGGGWKSIHTFAREGGLKVPGLGDSRVPNGRLKWFWEQSSKRRFSS